MSKLIVPIFSLFFYLFIFQTANAAEVCTLTTIPEQILIPEGQARLALHSTIQYNIHVSSSGTFDVVFNKGLGGCTTDDVLCFGFWGFSNVTPNSEGFLIKNNSPLIQNIGGNEQMSDLFREGNHQIEIYRKGTSGKYCALSYSILKKDASQQIDCNLIGPSNPASDSIEIKYSGKILPSGLYRLIIPSINKTGDEFRSDGNGIIPEQNLGLFNTGNFLIKLQTKVEEKIGVGGQVGEWKDTNCIIRPLTVALNVTPSPPTNVGSGTPGGLKDPGKTTSGCTGDNCTSAGGIVCDIDSKTPPDPKNPPIPLPGKAGIYTAIGCIPTEPSAFVQGFIKVAIGAGGGIALLLMIYGAFQMITSAGNPDGVKKGHEQITSAVIGLLFIIFAVMLLKIIGVDILQIPGFSP